MAILVTGASGGLGRAAIQALLRRGVPAHQVIATSRNPDAVSDLSDRGVQVRAADFDRPNSLRDAFAGAERMLLVSSNTRDPEARYAGHRAAVDAARDAGASLIVYTSLLHADSAQMHATKSHYRTEKYLRTSGVPYVILRNSSYFENQFALLPIYRASGIIYGTAGNGRISAALRAEYAEAAATVIATEGYEGSTYELGGDSAYTQTELADLLSHRWSRHIEYVDLPADELPAAATKIGIPDYFVPVLLDTHDGAKRGELYTDSGDLNRLLGRQPSTLAEALSEPVEKD